MAKYEFTSNTNLFFQVTVDAESLDDAIEKAYEICGGDMFSITPDGCIKPTRKEIKIIDCGEEFDDWEEI